MPGNAAMQIVDCPPNYLRKENPDPVGQENANRSHNVIASVLLKVGKQRTQTLRQHVASR